jgi:hypothetical protein
MDRWLMQVIVPRVGKDHGTDDILIQVKKDLGIFLHWHNSSFPDLESIQSMRSTLKVGVTARIGASKTVCQLRRTIQEEWG